METLFAPAVVVAAATVAVITDTRRGRIPNWLTFPLFVSGLMVSFGMHGWDGLAAGLQGAGLAVALLLVPFLTGGIGAGDIKLLAGIGAWLGPQTALQTLFFAALLGAVVALVLLVRGYGMQAVALIAARSWRGLILLASTRARRTVFPYASAIWFGLAVTLVAR